MMSARPRDISAYRSLPGVHAIIESKNIMGISQLVDSTHVGGMQLPDRVPLGDVVLCTARKDCMCKSVIRVMVISLFAVFLIIMFDTSYGCKIRAR